MKLGLKGAKIAIAGASHGLGLGIAQAFHEEEAEVWLTGRTEATLKQASAKLGSAPFTACDLETDAGRDLFFESVSERWKKLDALILNFGGTQAKVPGFDSSDEEWLRLFNQNFLTQVALIRRFKTLLKTSEQASIVAISSIAGEMRLPAPLAYSTSKAALNHLCGSAVTELSNLGIRFNVVSPGNILYPSGRWEQRLNERPDEMKKMLETSVPLKRFGTPEEIASFVVFLASKKASFCTGSVVRVDGGQSPVT